MDLSPTHLHLLLNHFPTIGFIIGLTLYVAALYANSDHLKQAALVIFVGVALLAIPTYASGNAAETAICISDLDRPCQDPNVSRALIEAHEGAAFASLAWMFVTGGFAWLGLYQYRRLLKLPRWNAILILLLSVVTLVTVSRAANLGGEIRHPEIRVTQLQPTTARPLARVVGNYVRDTPAAWIIAETLHFVGLSLLIGVLLLINLRTLGVLQTVPFGAIDRLLPWAVLGFGLNAVTGMLFFAAAYGQYVSGYAWYCKLGFIVAAGFNTLYFFFDKGWAVEPGQAVRPLSRLIAFSALFFWVGVMYWGSMLPFLGNAF
jgi:uncharacterized membrane protein